MNLVIHDLSPEAWARIEADYAGRRRGAGAKGLRPAELYRRL